MRANADLVKWQGGWRWVNTAETIRIEMFQTHSGDAAEVLAKATAELETYRDGQTEITVAVDTPGIEWGTDLIEGDEVNVDGAWREIEAYTSQRDNATGKWVDVPQFGVLLDPPEQRIQRTLRGIGGLNGGTSHLTRPASAPQQPNVRPG